MGWDTGPTDHRLQIVDHRVGLGESESRVHDARSQIIEIVGEHGWICTQRIDEDPRIRLVRGVNCDRRNQSILELLDSQLDRHASYLEDAEA
jgi:hypothetical protein